MIIKEKGTNIEITQEIRQYLYKKLEHLKKFINPTDGGTLCEVEIGRTTVHHKNGDIFRTEINLRFAGKNLRAVSEKDELFASIDLAKDEMMSGLKAVKEKSVSKARKGELKIKKMKKNIIN